MLSRLRKTHKALWYRKTEGRVARFAVGHTSEVAARAYADVAALRPLHDRAVADAFEEQVALARGPRIELEPEPPATEVAPAEMSPSPPGDQDVWLARCGGFYASPHAPAGEACPTPFWGCLDCSNAVITARKLPSILAFQSFVERQRERLDAEDWSAKFGRVHRRITEQVLPAFGEAVVAQARHEAASLYLPPEATL